jgi:hypothetical protein
MITAKGWVGVTLLGVLKEPDMDDASGMRPKFRRLGDLCSRSPLVRDERGIALVMALAVVLVLTVLLASVIFLTSSSARDAQHSNAGQKARALAEAGLNNALAVLSANYPNTQPVPGKRCLLNPQVVPAGFPGTAPPWGTGDPAACGNPAPIPFTPDSVNHPGETASWWGTLRIVTGLGIAWVIQSTGSIPNPTGPSTGPAASPVTKTLTVKVPVVFGVGEPITPDSALNWIYADGDLTFNNSVSIGSPVFTNGNLILDQSASILGTAGEVDVGGVAYLNTKSNPGGTNGTRIGQAPPSTDPSIGAAHIRGGCEYKGNYIGSTPVRNNPCTSGDNVFSVTPPDTTLRSPAPNPAMTCCVVSASNTYKEFGFWYQYAQPGPFFGCDAATRAGTPPTFDTDQLINNSSINPAGGSNGDWNLTPNGQAYTCQTIGGELSWDGVSHLTVRGTIYIDGSANVDNTGAPGNTVYTYSGTGTIYVTGTFAMKGTTLCATVFGNSCDIRPNKWDPNTTALVIVAWGDGAGDPPNNGTAAVENQGNTVFAGAGIQLIGSAAFQGALVAHKGVEVGQSAVMEGPMISMSSYVNSGQTGILTFPAVHFAPSGGPGNPPPPVVILAPRDYGG